MNKFEKSFFRRYVPEWQEIKGVIHGHWIIILRVLFVWINLWAFIPSFLYYNSIMFREKVPFYYLEWLLIVVFLKVIYEIFNWYNDVWIITSSWVVDLDWAMFNVDMKTVKYDNIEWVWVEQVWIWDTILNKWDIVIHKIWEDRFVLEDAIIPYDALDEIEKISKQQWVEEHEDRFDMIMDVLSGVVENYLKDNKPKFDSGDINPDDITEEIEKIKKGEGTIDLR